MSLDVVLGWQRNLLDETPDHAKVVHLTVPFLFENELETLKERCRTIPAAPRHHLACRRGPRWAENALVRLCHEAGNAVQDGCASSSSATAPSTTTAPPFPPCWPSAPCIST
jgi:hypothetical protein